MSHPHDRLSAFLDGELAPPERAEVEGHLRTCAECARSLEDLPQAAREYLDFIVDNNGVPITLIGFGPGREQIIWTEAARALEAAAAA